MFKTGVDPLKCYPTAWLHSQWKNKCTFRGLGQKRSNPTGFGFWSSTKKKQSLCCNVMRRDVTWESVHRGFPWVHFGSILYSYCLTWHEYPSLYDSTVLLESVGVTFTSTIHTMRNLWYFGICINHPNLLKSPCKPQSWILATQLSDGPSNVVFTLRGTSAVGSE